MNNLLAMSVPVKINTAFQKKNIYSILVHRDSFVLPKIVVSFISYLALPTVLTWWGIGQWRVQTLSSFEEVQISTSQESIENLSFIGKHTKFAKITKIWEFVDPLAFNGLILLTLLNHLPVSLKTRKKNNKVSVVLGQNLCQISSCIWKKSRKNWHYQ